MTLAHIITTESDYRLVPTVKCLGVALKFLIDAKINEIAPLSMQKLNNLLPILAENPRV